MVTCTHDESKFEPTLLNATDPDLRYCPFHDAVVERDGDEWKVVGGITKASYR